MPITPIPQRACAHCGKLFFPQAANQAYHNDLCRQNAYRQRSRKRRETKEPNISQYFNTYFAQVFQDVTPSTAEAIWKGAEQDPKRRYAVFSWTDPDNTIVPPHVCITREAKDGIEYHNVSFDPDREYPNTSITERTKPFDLEAYYKSFGMTPPSSPQAS